MGHMIVTKALLWVVGLFAVTQPEPNRLERLAFGASLDQSVNRAAAHHRPFDDASLDPAGATAAALDTPTTQQPSLRRLNRSEVLNILRNASIANTPLSSSRLAQVEFFSADGDYRQRLKEPVIDNVVGKYTVNNEGYCVFVTIKACYSLLKTKEGRLFRIRLNQYGKAILEPIYIRGRTND
jgi:hypothetical protein